METRITNVVITRDGGQDCWDTTITARDIAKAFKYGLLEVDPERQRGKNSVTGKYVLKTDKVERWTRELQDDTAIFGQLTWNFRPQHSDIEFVPDQENPAHGTLVVRSGTAYLPDSVHRHHAIRRAVESVAAGSSFDPGRRFSLRIWRVPEEFENSIFYAMNMEHDKADATRSKWLAQKNEGQKIAREIVRRSPHLGEANVETVTNNLSIKNPRLAAFNTFAAGFEEAWADTPSGDVEEVVTWFLSFWEKLVEVLPELKRLPLPERQRSRRESLAGWAIAIQGYIRLARRLYDAKLNLEVLRKLAAKEKDEKGKTYNFFAWTNPVFQKAGIIVPAVNKKGETKLTVRNSHQTRRAMAEVLSSKIGIEPKAVQAAA
ncbi:MAG TPA: DNA sulfur modification protein DndB [Xanthobacteraceae bacterium]|nr:DNA sulfur modification protein DndB [Xanthobacteraceae bacterium]